MIRFFVAFVAVVSLFCYEIASGQNIVYSRDIYPILQQHCTPCHIDNAVAPFSLFDYKELQKNAATIKAVVKSGYMPPWRADTSYRHFANENILSSEEKMKLISWIDSGLKVDVPVKYSGPKHGTVVGRKPDVTISMKKAFLIKGNNKDQVVQFCIPIDLEAEADIAILEFVPGNRKLIHHCNPIIFKVDSSRKYNIKDATYLEPVLEEEFPYVEPFPKVDIIYYGGWLPGSSAMTFPDSIGFHLPKHSYMTLNIHYAPTSVDAWDQSSINLYFSEKKVTRNIFFNNLGSDGGIVEPSPPLVIPPESKKQFQLRYTVKNDYTLYYCVPHMHLIGRSFKAYMLDGSGDTIPLVKIDNWDFRWQEFYKLKKPLKIAKGTEIIVEAEYDNTSRNHNNPYSPPRIIRQGPLTSQEMLTLTMMVTEYKPGDEDAVP